MNFKSEKQLKTYLNSLEFIGQGSQGICYLDKTNNIVIKIFHDFFEEGITSYKKEDIVRFNNIKNKTFIWASDVIMINDIVVGYTMPYISSRNLWKINPLMLNLDTLLKGIKNAILDFNILSENNIVIYDIMYNILYNNGTFKIIDTLEYSYGDKVKDNMRGFNLEIMLFLVDNYFDDFVNKNLILKEMYLSDSVSCIEFIEALRYALSSYIGTKITRLNEAKKLIRRKEKPIYIRN